MPAAHVGTGEPGGSTTELAFSQLPGRSTGTQATARASGGSTGATTSTVLIARTTRRVCGCVTWKDDFVLPSTKAALSLFDQHKIRYSYKETAGGHTWPNWRAYLNEFAPLLFR